MKTTIVERLRRVRAALAAATGLLALAAVPGAAHGAEEFGIYERILEASGTFDETSAAFEAALARSALVLHGKFDLVLPEPAQRARVYVLTAPQFMAAAGAEAPATASAQVLRVAIYEYGLGRHTQIDMTNPLAHAMVYYAGSGHYDALLAQARITADDVRRVAAAVPGRAVDVQLEPRRSEAALNAFRGDGMARMMAKWRNWQESQGVLFVDQPGNFAAALERVERAIKASTDRGPGDASGWRLVARVPVGANAVVFGISSAYVEATSVRINSGSRSDGKSKDAPFPGVDHAPALPLEILVINDGTQVRAVEYGQMWRMQLYFWDSGYLAFAGNSGVPGTLYDSIATMIAASAPAADAAPTAGAAHD